MTGWPVISATTSPRGLADGVTALRHAVGMTSPRVIRERINDAYGLDPRRALVAVRELARVDVPWLERRAVLLARRNGDSWGSIGRALHRTRQSVRERYVDIDGTPPDLLPLPLGDVDRFREIWFEGRADDRRRREFDELGDGDVVAW